jgi:hypothetical protein
MNTKIPVIPKRTKMEHVYLGFLFIYLLASSILIVQHKINLSGRVSATALSHNYCGPSRFVQTERCQINSCPRSTILNVYLFNVFPLVPYSLWHIYHGH